MKTADESCHGALDCLLSGSDRRLFGSLFKPWQKLSSYIAWHVENFGWSQGLAEMCLRIGNGRGATSTRGDRRETLAAPDVLALQPGEWVEVRSIEEILATLDRNRRNRGLLWMTGMRKHCGKQYRVYRRVERITLETNGEPRTMKNTVLLEDCLCDGAAFGGCDRSCFHFWREAWLKRVANESRAETQASCDVPTLWTGTDLL
jgi:hypothetical protein